MTCDHCVRHVTDAISKVAGVKSVNVSLADGIATFDSVRWVADFITVELRQHWTEDEWRKFS